jgi:predicted secreted hydrolase
MKSKLSAFLILLFVVSSQAADYKVASPGYQYHFPRDHFAHPDYQTEWWYYTGNVKSTDGHRFGYELTFFRQGVTRDTNTSTWQIHDLYMAHLALSDISRRRFYHVERLNRAGPGIAGVDQQTGVIWNGNWQVQLDDRHQTLRGIDEKFSIQFNLAPAKPPVIHGLNGISQKAEGRGHASHYISFTRLRTSGSIELNGTTYDAVGTSWMDHEFFTDATDSGESGWDWLSLQLNDNTEVMLYRLRHKDGSVDPHSSGTYIDSEGNSLFLSSTDFTMTPTGDTWTSKQSQGTYPARWRVSIPKLSLQMDIATPLVSQELVGSVGPTYWEGAIDITGNRAGNALAGVGYLEMTGYASAFFITH